MEQPSGAVGRLLDRLTPPAKPSTDQADTPNSTGPLDWLRSTAARLAGREGLERLLPIGVCGLLLTAALISSLPEVSPATASQASDAAAGAAAPLVHYGEGDGPLATGEGDIYLGDGSIPNTLQNPGVGTDASTLLRTYTVKKGDTLTGIANRFGLAPSTVYWANSSQIADPCVLRIGQVLLITPMDGLIVKVGAKDTLDSIATRYRVSAQDIIDANNLPEAKVTAGQTLIIPGASGGAVPKCKTQTTARAAGSWVWPVAGTSYISQYYWSGHHAIDIAADYGTPVVATNTGTVVFAGWRSYTGGGNVVWIMHGSKLYSTYNHLSRWNVHVGQRVYTGTRIGSVGTSGVATGPHLHFEVWLGIPWALGNDSDTVNPCRYLAGC